MREEITALLLAEGVTEPQARALCDYAEFLVSENEKYNLTALTAPEDVAVKHFLDSLLPLRFGLLPEGVIAMSDPRFYDPYGGQKDL